MNQLIMTSSRASSSPFRLAQLALLLISLRAAVSAEKTASRASAESSSAAGQEDAFHCFKTREELDQAIDDYNQGGDSPAKSDVLLVHGPIRTWCFDDTLTDFSHLFDAYAEFDVDLSGWNLSHVTTAAGMFYRASSFNQDVSMWNMQNVVDMDGMFAYASAFNQDISSWNVASAQSMRSMFVGARGFRHGEQLVKAWHLIESSAQHIDVTHMWQGSASAELVLPFHEQEETQNQEAVSHRL